MAKLAKKSPYWIIQTVLFSLVGVMVFSLLLHLWLTPNIETSQNRATSGYVQVEHVSYSEGRDETGLVRQFRFALDEDIAYDTTLIFRFNHANTEVYLDGEKVYSLYAAEQMGIVRTPGGQWAMIPLFREDEGKEVLVEMRPVYEDYQNQSIRFLIGSRLSVYETELQKALPELLLSLADIFSGLLLLVVAIYFSVKKQDSGGLYALGALALSLGLWNITQIDFILMITPEKNTFLYYVSVTMLAVSVFALTKSVRPSRKRKTHWMREMWIIAYALFVVVQLTLQMLGVADLRQTLTVIHVALAITAINLIAGNIVEWKEAREKTGGKRRVDSVWILGVGVLLDLINYYTGFMTQTLFFVLSAVLIYVLLEGVHLFVAYTRQRQALEEKETQLTMSRITTMMSQIRSHFVFNVLNAISGMCKYDPEKADDTIVRFSRYLRSNIDIMENDKNVPFLQEMERLEDYVVLEQIRFGDRLVFTTDLEATQFSIPPLILQPIVENAIKHGISKKQTGGKILLKTRETENHILITISDDGMGFPMEALNKETSVGLRNIRFRLYHLVGGTMDIKSQLGVGTTVTLTIPKEE